MIRSYQRQPRRLNATRSSPGRERNRRRFCFGVRPDPFRNPKRGRSSPQRPLSFQAPGVFVSTSSPYYYVLPSSFPSFMVTRSILGWRLRLQRELDLEPLVPKARHPRQLRFSTNGHKSAWVGTIVGNQFESNLCAILPVPHGLAMTPPSLLPSPLLYKGAPLWLRSTGGTGSRVPSTRKKALPPSTGGVPPLLPPPLNKDASSFVCSFVGSFVCTSDRRAPFSAENAILLSVVVGRRWGRRRCGGGGRRGGRVEERRSKVVQ